MMIQAASYTLSLREREGTHFSGEGEGISPSSPSHALTPRDARPSPAGRGFMEDA